MNVRKWATKMAGEHPAGLFLLFFVEMWERFSYYGMRALLVLYMTKALAFSTEYASSVYAWYTGLVYLTPLIGGYVADRYLGARLCILIGGLLMAAGHFAMAIPGLSFFYSALGLLIVGNGFFKPNISTTVGKLYEEEDPRRNGGFTIFYMGINLGAFFSPLVCGSLGEKVGWHWGFAAAGVGMIFGLGLYLWGQTKYLGDAGLRPAPRSAEGHDDPLTLEEKRHIAVIFIMAFFVIFFWSAFEQAGSSMTLFADQSTDRHIFGWEFPTSWFQSVNPLLIFVLAPLFSKLWIWMAKKELDPSTPAKFVWGLGLAALGFVIMAAAAYLYQQGGAVSIFWLLGAYLFHTLGELCLSPIGLALVTRLSPAKFASLLMGVWFTANFFANFLAGIFAGNYDSMSHVTFFLIPVGTAGGAAVILYLLKDKIRDWMKPIK